jgi:uncharacterized protein YutE (UPF0331/DUF86 family)
MTGVNVEFVKEKARAIREAVEKVRFYSSIPDSDFFSDERNLYTVMHLLLRAIEATASICTHLIAKFARRAPASYTECFEAMKELGMVDEDLAARLVRMVRFRNLLVHQYWKVDPAKVLAFARENLGDFDAFLESVRSFLGRR